MSIAEIFAKFHYKFQSEFSKLRHDKGIPACRSRSAAQKGDFSFKYMPHYILPLSRKSFPEGFISLLDKKQHKVARAYLDNLVKTNAIRFQSDGIEILQPARL